MTETLTREKTAADGTVHVESVCDDSAPYTVYAAASVENFAALSRFGKVWECADKVGNPRLCVNYEFDWADTTGSVFATV